MKLSYVLEQTPDWFASAKPGQAFSYSNTNYVLLALLIEALTGQSYRDHMVSAFFAPLGMRNTGTVQALGVSSVPLAEGYRNLGFGVSQIEEAHTASIDTEGDGGLYSNAEDLLVWQKAFWQGKIVSSQTIDLMSRPGQTDTGVTFDYGLGLQAERSDSDGRWIGHGGSWVSSTTFMGHYPDVGVSIVILANETMAPVERMSQRALKTLI
ncbi:MAG: serine hydrolase domain-containing protein, partial [Pseudomonadota bacterium]